MQIGAGAIGRGFLAERYAAAGYDTTLVDVNTEQIAEINRRGEYVVHAVSAQGVEESVISGVDAVDIRDTESFTRSVVEAEMITTAVGPGALEKVAPALAAALVERAKRRPRDELHVVVIACENITDNTARLKEHIWAHLTPEQQTKLEGTISFPNCAVDRIVPVIGVSDEPLDVTVEKYFSLIVDETRLNGPMPAIPGVKLSRNLVADSEQKLFTLNTTHGVTAWLGRKAGYEYIHEAIQDPTIRSLVEGTLAEIEPVIAGRFESISVEDQRAFAARTVERFGNPYLRDTVERVGRDPIRKLGPKDRLIRPAMLTFEQGTTPAHLASGIVAALQYRNPDDPQAAELARRISHERIESVLIDVSGLEQGHPVVNMVKATYELDELGRAA